METFRFGERGEGQPHPAEQPRREEIEKRLASNEQWYRQVLFGKRMEQHPDDPRQLNEILDKINRDRATLGLPPTEGKDFENEEEAGG